MQTKTIGIILLIIGIIMIAYTGFNYVTTETLVDLGPINVETKKNNFVKFSPFIGGAIAIVGVFLLLWRNKAV